MALRNALLVGVAQELLNGRPVFLDAVRKHCAQARRLACKIKTSSDFADAEFATKSRPIRPQMQRVLPKFGRQPSPFDHVSGVPCWGDARGTAQSGSVQMARLVIDLVLFSCTFAFVTGIVIAAANLLI
jgi:hypothetical protein